MPAPDPQTPVPRGRHAPPLEVRLTVQRRRLFDAAARVFSRDGYATASAERIAREAGMSKATFYEHFANKEECILALFDESITEVMRAMEAVADTDESSFPNYADRVRAGMRAFLSVLVRFPDQTRTVLVEIIGAGPRAALRRDEVLDNFAAFLVEDNARHAAAHGASVFTGPDDAFAVVGAIVELVSRQLRTGQPARVEDLEDVMTRVMLGTLQQGAPRVQAAS